MAIPEAQIRDLVEAARAARQGAYAPYSEFPVGAALLTDSGRVYQGANIENAAYPLSMCAERVAAFQAVAQGDRGFSALAVVTENGGSPCGACRQVLSEFGTDLLVLMVDQDGHVVRQVSLGELLPHAFGPTDLA